MATGKHIRIELKVINVMCAKIFAILKCLNMYISQFKYEGNIYIERDTRLRFISRISFVYIRKNYFRHCIGTLKKRH